MTKTLDRTIRETGATAFGGSGESLTPGHADHRLQPVFRFTTMFVASTMPVAPKPSQTLNAPNCRA